MKQIVLDELVEAAMSWAYPEGPVANTPEVAVINEATIRSDILKVFARHRIKIAPQNIMEAGEQQATPKYRHF